MSHEQLVASQEEAVQLLAAVLARMIVSGGLYG